MTINPNDPRIRALAELVHQLRPAWNRAGIAGALHAASTKPIDQLCRVAIDAALDPSAATPAVIAHRDGDGWTPHGRQAAPPPLFEQLDLGRPDPGAAARGAAAARAVLLRIKED